MTKDINFQLSNKNKFVSFYFSVKLGTNEVKNLSKFKHSQSQISNQIFFEKLKWLVFHCILFFSAIDCDHLRIDLLDCVANLLLED